MRYKEYNKNKVLESCLDLFWEKSFRGCSVNDIVEATGVNRFSLYHEFENKEGILYNSLKLYRERYCAEKFDILKENGNVKEIIERFYFSFLNNDYKHQGCYFIHIGTEMADADAETKKLLEDYLETVEQLFVQLLIRHNTSEKDAVMLAKHLVGLFCTSVSFCLIHTDAQKQAHISNGIKVLLHKTQNYATSA